MKTQIIGNEAENKALLFLESKGLRLMERNFSCRLGEIDLIMRDEKCLVFIEVRKRTNPLYGSGAETVTQAKQRKIIKTAQFFLLNHAIGNYDCRFDVISINEDVDWIKHAFTLD